MTNTTHKVLVLALLSVLAFGLMGCDGGATESEPGEDAGTMSARELYDAGEFDEAIEVLTGTLDADPDDTEARRTLALACAATGDLDGAIAEYGEVLVREPDDHRTLYRMGLLERQAGDSASAADHLGEAAELHPTDPSYWDEYAKTLIQIGRAEEAAVAWGRILGLPDITDETRKQILVSQGEAYVTAKMMDEAATSYEAAIEVDPSDQNLRDRLAEIEGDPLDG